MNTYRQSLKKLLNSPVIDQLANWSAIIFAALLALVLLRLFIPESLIESWFELLFAPVLGLCCFTHGLAILKNRTFRYFRKSNPPVIITEKHNPILFWLRVIADFAIAFIMLLTTLYS